MSNLSKSQYHYFTDHLSQLKRGLIEALADKIEQEGTEDAQGYTGLNIKFDRYTRLVIIDGCLTLLDNDALSYNVWCADIENLIEILNS